MSTHFVGEGNIGSAPDYREFPNGNDGPRRLLRLNVYFDNPIPKKDGKTGQVEVDAHGKPKNIMLLRTYPVFNVEQLQAPETAVLLDGRHRQHRHQPRGLASALQRSKVAGGEVGPEAGRKVVQFSHDRLPYAANV